MTDRTQEVQEAVNRLAVLFSTCPANVNDKGHVWNMDSKSCWRCGKPFPYIDDEYTPQKTES